MGAVHDCANHMPTLRPSIHYRFPARRKRRPMEEIMVVRTRCPHCGSTNLRRTPSSLLPDEDSIGKALICVVCGENFRTLRVKPAKGSDAPYSGLLIGSIVGLVLGMAAGFLYDHLNPSPRGGGPHNAGPDLSGLMTAFRVIGGAVLGGGVGAGFGFMVGTIVGAVQGSGGRRRIGRAK